MVPASLVPPPTPSVQGLPSGGPAPLDVPFGPNVRVSDDSTAGDQNEIALAVASDGRIHMGWNDFRAPLNAWRCGYSYSTDGGLTWSTNRQFHVAPFQYDADPVVVVDSASNVYFVCLSYNFPSASQVEVFRSTDGGVTFSPPVVVSDTPTGFADKPWAHAVGTRVYVCYTNFVGGSTELRYTLSTDGGQTWWPTRTLDLGGQGCTFAHSDAGTLYAAWRRSGAIYAWSSADAGATWSPARYVGAAPFPLDPQGTCGQRANNMPSLAADRASDKVYAVWTVDTATCAWDIRSSGSSNGAQTWSAPATVNDVLTGKQFMPFLDVDSAGVLHAAWYDDRSGLMAVRYASSSTSGATWSASTRVTDTQWTTTLFIGDYIALVADAQGRVNVGWTDRRTGQNEAYFAQLYSAGPPRLAQITVSPPEVWTDADTAVAFTAQGFDQYAQPFPVNPAWEATGGSVASGTYVPARAGDWQVWANESGVSGSALVHVAPGTLARIAVTPADATITADDVQPYAAQGYDAHDNAVSVSPAWGVSAGSITSGGLYVPVRVGTWTVYANASGISGSTSVTVTPGRLATITLTPPTATITADDVQPYAAQGYDAKGNARPLVAPLWAATGGTIDGLGVYHPQRAGAWGVWANESGVSGSATITVLPGALARIDVAPRDPVVSADQTVPFTATGYDAKGNAVPISPVWTASAGSIDAASGLYTPGPVGTHAVAATVGSVSGSTSVTVRAGPLARIDVVPSPVTITADDILPLTALGYDVRGNSVAVSPTWSATCGAVDAFGVYTPGPARLCLAYANESGISGVGQITVIPGRLARIDVTPPSATITADETAAYAANGYDAKANPVPVTPAWSAEQGTIDASGRYAPGPAGTWEVRATDSGIAGIALVTVTPGAVVRLAVVPPVVTITADETATFQAVGIDRAGNTVPVAGPAWSVEDGSISSQGLFTPRPVGTWRVTATSGGLTGFANATVRPGAVATVVLDPPSGRVAEGSSLPFKAHARDAKGNDVPDATFDWRAEGNVGQVDGAGVFTATHGGQGQVVVTASGGGGTANATAAVVVDGSLASALANPFVLLPLLLLLIVPIVLVVLWRRRRRRDPDPPSP